MDSKETKQKPIIDLDDFDDQVSLWQLIPAAEGKALKQLRLIVDSALNGKVEKESIKPQSLLLTGKHSKRTYARCFLRALGLVDIRETTASMLVDQSAFEEFFHGSTPDTGFLIANAHNMRDQLVKGIYQILNEGQQYRYNLNTFQKQLIPVMGTVVLTAASEKYVQWDIKESFSHQVEIEDYTETQVELVCLQRLLYSNIEMESDQVLKEFIKLRKTFPSTLALLRNSVLVMLADGRNMLTVEDVRKASYFK